LQETTEVTITRVGSNQKYAEGWERAFGKKKASAKPKKASAKASADAAPAKKKKSAKK